MTTVDVSSSSWLTGVARTVYLGTGDLDTCIIAVLSRGTYNKMWNLDDWRYSLELD